MSSILADQIDLQPVDSHNYTSSWHLDWTAGPAVHGGCIAALIHHTAIRHTTTTLAGLKQPDILSLHYDFLTSSTASPFLITVTELKVGKIISSIRLELRQSDVLRVVAIATLINFDVPLGPTADTGWILSPPFKSVPDFEKITLEQPDDDWVSGIMTGEVYPFTNRILLLYPRIGSPIGGPLDIWSKFGGEEKISGAYLSLLADTVPSMSDTLLHNGGLFDAHRFAHILQTGAKEHPGVPTKAHTTLREAARATIWNNTVSLDIDFKKRLPKEGLDWIHMRLLTKRLQNGRMDLDMTMCDDKLDIICSARQIVLVLEAKKKFTKPSSRM
ncbi:hypothetical protein CBS101457_002975 [Exobasidium rhododendri]|nr:hypothetical protein CBS101457_002975 [Exobasidium rhododendri]